MEDRKQLKKTNRVDPSRMPGFCGYVLRNTDSLDIGGAKIRKEDNYYFVDEVERNDGGDVTRIRIGGNQGKRNGVKVWADLAEAEEALRRHGGELLAVRLKEDGTLCRIWGWSETGDED